MGPKVFITQYMPSVNFAKAEQFGEVSYLTKDEYRPNPSFPGYNDAITGMIKKEMTKYIPGVDFIMTTGSALPNVVVGSMLIRGRHNFLKWSARMNDYEIFTLEIN